MSVNKKAYFQGGGGVNEPTPGEKKYKSDPALLIQPRFEEPLYYNYDLYTIPGMEHIGPGTGYHGLQNYDSVQEFLEARRQRMKGRYVADDSWILDDNSKTKKNPNIKARATLLSKLVKTAIDFPIDDQVNHYDQMIYPEEAQYQIRRERGDRYSFPSEGDPLGPENLNISMTTPQIAGEHSYLPEDDWAGRSNEALNFGRDYDEDGKPARGLDDDILEKLLNKYLSSSETDLFGLPDGIDPNSDLDAEETEQNEEPYTGTSDIGTDIYEDKWNI